MGTNKVVVVVVVVVAVVWNLDIIWVNLPIVDTIHSKGNKFVMDVKTLTTALHTQQ